MTTANRSYNTPATGADVDLWGQNDLNPNFNLIDKNLGAVNAIALSNANVSLNATQLSYGVVRLTGALSASVQIIFPAIQGWWTIDNQCTGNFYVLINITGQPGRYIGVPQGIATDIYLDGTNVCYRNPPLIGSYWDYAGASVPDWVGACAIPPYLNCDGTAFNVGNYPYLNTILGGNTLPDLRGRYRAALNGGTGRITTAGGGVDGNTRFAAGGVQTSTLLQTDLPNVTLSLSGNLTNANVTIGNQSQFNATSANFPGGTPMWGIGVNSLGFTGSLVSTALTGTTSSINTGVTQTPFTNLPPTAIGGITMIRAA